MITTRAERVVKPQDCVLAFAIPLSKAGFAARANCAAATPDSPKSFVNLFPGGWEQYASQVVAAYKRCKRDFDNLQVQVVTKLTLDQFGALLRDKSHSVITLFSHWDEAGIEFDDGFAGAGAILEKAPLDFDGVIDLCVCHPLPVVEALLSRPARQYIVRHIGGGATPGVWLPFYGALYHHLQTSNVTYTQALDELIEEFFRQIGEEI